MPHLSPMNWTMMLIGSWTMLMMILMNFFFHDLSSMTNNNLMTVNMNKMNNWKW